MIGHAEFDLDGFRVCGEKNWRVGGFPARWWWGKTHGFQRPDVCVAFAGGDVSVGPVPLLATAPTVRFGNELVRLGHQLISPVTAEVGDGRWRLRAAA